MGGARTCFNDARARGNVEVSGDEGDVGEVEDLGAVWEGHCPQLWGGAEDVDEALA